MIRFDRKDLAVTLNDRPVTTGTFGLKEHVRREWRISEGAKFSIDTESFVKYTFGFHSYGSYYYALLASQGTVLSWVQPDNENEVDFTESGEKLYVGSSEITYGKSLDFGEDVVGVVRNLVVQQVAGADWFSANLRRFVIDHDVFYYEKALTDLVKVMAKTQDEDACLRVALFTFFEGTAVTTLVFCLNALLQHAESSQGLAKKVVLLNDIEAQLHERALTKGIVPDDFVPVLWKSN